jgi:hypothetical protein
MTSSCNFTFDITIELTTYTHFMGHNQIIQSYVILCSTWLDEHYTNDVNDAPLENWKKIGVGSL